MLANEKSLEQPMALNCAQNSDQPTMRCYPAENHASLTALENTRDHNVHILVEMLGRPLNDDNRPPRQVPNPLIEFRVRFCHDHF
jgi:hypothetical protein